VSSFLLSNSGVGIAISGIGGMGALYVDVSLGAYIFSWLISDLIFLACDMRLARRQSSRSSSTPAPEAPAMIPIFALVDRSADGFNTSDAVELGAVAECLISLQFDAYLYPTALYLWKYDWVV
jgi:hypothetical protein